MNIVYLTNAIYFNIVIWFELRYFYYFTLKCEILVIRLLDKKNIFLVKLRFEPQYFYYFI
jgi:hypothetical protein